MRRGGTYLTSCGPFALLMDHGERISPSSVSDFRNALFNVELLSDARTLLADFFSILLVPSGMPMLIDLSRVGR